MEHSHARAILPQWYSDQFGWEEIVAETVKAYNQLSPPERPGLRDFRPRLRTGGRHRFFWAAVRIASGAERASDLLPLGSTRLFRKLLDRAGRLAGTSSRVLRALGIRGHLPRQSVCFGAGHPGLYLQGRKVRITGRGLATIEEMAIAMLPKEFT
jgi:hypothetical protein